MHVLETRRAVAGKHYRFPSCQSFKNSNVEIAGRIDRRPARPADVARMENGSGKALRALIEQIALDRRFLNSVIAEGLARCALVVRTRSWCAVHPDGAAVQKQPDTTAEHVDELARRALLEADEIDHDLGREARDARSIRPILLSLAAIEG